MANINTVDELFTDEHIPDEEPQEEEEVVKPNNNQFVREEESVFGLPNIEDIRKKTDDALQISISKIGSVITEASSLGERTVVVPKEEFPNSNVNKIKEELEKAGYNTYKGVWGTLVISW